MLIEPGEHCFGGRIHSLDVWIAGHIVKREPRVCTVSHAQRSPNRGDDRLEWKLWGQPEEVALV